MNFIYTKTGREGWLEKNAYSFNNIQYINPFLYWEICI